MAAPTLNSISPLSGPPGSVVTCLGAGFDPGARVGCPMLAETTYVGPGELRAAIPADLRGADGTSLAVNVYAQNSDGSTSEVKTFTVLFGRAKQQAWTTIEAVVGEVPGFVRAGRISDATIQGWIRTTAQQINAALVRRGLSLDPADWQQPAAESASPNPADVLELANRYGAAAKLAGAIAGQFQGSSGEWPLLKNLRTDYERELKAFDSGAYDAMFKPAAAGAESGTLVGGAELVDDAGEAESAFSKSDVF